MDISANPAFGSPANLTKSEVQAYALSVCKKIGYHTGSSMKGVIRYLGGDVHYARDSCRFSLIVEAREDFMVNLFADKSVEQDNFSLATYIGRYTMHYAGEPMRVLKDHVPSELSRQTLNEAVWFAEEFMMPSDELQSAWRDLRGNVGMVAKHFGVSHLIADLRTSTLGPVAVG